MTFKKIKFLWLFGTDILKPLKIKNLCNLAKCIWALNRLDQNIFVFDHAAFLFTMCKIFELLECLVLFVAKNLSLMSTPNPNPKDDLIVFCSTFFFHYPFTLLNDIDCRVTGQYQFYAFEKKMIYFLSLRKERRKNPLRTLAFYYIYQNLTFWYILLYNFSLPLWKFALKVPQTKSLCCSFFAFKNDHIDHQMLLVASDCIFFVTVWKHI